MADVSVGDRVGVVVTTHEGPGARLDRCLDALVASDPTLHVVVVDNSGRGSPFIRPESDNIEHVQVDNRGFGAAANVGAAHPSVSDRDFVAVLNDDVTVDPGWLAPLVACLDAEPNVGAAQPKLVLADTEPPLVNSLGVELDRSGAGSDIGYRTLESDTGPDMPTDVDIVTGGAVLFRRACFAELDGFDERLFLYYEDVDLCLRGGERGWAFRCVPAARVEHDMGATTDAMVDERRRLQERNRLVTAARFAAPAVLARAVWLSVRRVRHQPRAAHLRGLLGGAALMPRALVERVAASKHRRRRAR